MYVCMHACICMYVCVDACMHMYVCMDGWVGIVALGKHHPHATSPRTHACKCMHMHGIHHPHATPTAHMHANACMGGHCGTVCPWKPSSTCHIHTHAHTCLHAYVWMGIVAIGNHHPHATSTHTHTHACMHACICTDGHCGDRKPSSTCHIHAHMYACIRPMLCGLS
jgi:hypothetical protein